MTIDNKFVPLESTDLIWIVWFDTVQFIDVMEFWYLFRVSGGNEQFLLFVTICMGELFLLITLIYTCHRKRVQLIIDGNHHIHVYWSSSILYSFLSFLYFYHFFHAQPKYCFNDTIDRVLFPAYQTYILYNELFMPHRTVDFIHFFFRSLVIICNYCVHRTWSKVSKSHLWTIQ